MSNAGKTGADAIISALQDQGIDTVFGVPGTQNIPLFEALRKSNIRTILATSETMAGFMAIGWYRATGKTGVFIAIPGPGFAFSLPALAEAALDSSAILLITGQSVDRGRVFDHQALDQPAVVEAICQTSHTVVNGDAVYDTVTRAIGDTIRAGARPVVIQIAHGVLENECSGGSAKKTISADQSGACELPDDLVQALRDCRRPLLIAGAGALTCPDEVDSFSKDLNVLITTMPPARGIVAENDVRVLPVDLLCDDVDAFNRLIDESDLIIALGCRFSHNGTGGYSMRLPRERLLHVHADPTVLQANYPAKWAISSDVDQFLAAASHAARDRQTEAGEGWTAERWRAEILQRLADEALEPDWPGSPEPGCRQLFDQLRGAIPDDAILVTDTGMHQIVTRKYFEVRSPRGMIVPTDFQSMGFGIPAAIGAALAAPGRQVVALVGDGTLLMTLSELVTIARERLPILIIVFADGWLGQIRMQQVAWGAPEFGTQLQRIDLEGIAKSVGIHYEQDQQNLGDQISACLQRHEPAILEIKMGDPLRLESLKNRMRRKERLKSMLGPAATRLVKKLTGRSS